MNRLIKDGDIILDGTLSRNDKTKQAFIKLENVERIMEEHELENVAELEVMLDDFDSLCEDVVSLTALTTAMRSYIISIGKLQESQRFVKEFLSDVRKENTEDGLLRH